MKKNRTLREKVERVFNREKTLPEAIGERFSSKTRFYTFSSLFFVILFFTYYYYWSHKKSFYLEAFAEIKLGSPIISTPIILNQNNKEYFYVADTSGSIYSFEIPSLNQHFKYSLEHSIIVPLAKVKTKEGESVLVFDNNIDGLVLKENGNYLYRKREESLLKGVIAKPLMFNLDGNNYAFASDVSGNIEAFSTEYGEILWQSPLALVGSPLTAAITSFKDGEILSALMLSQSGKLILLNLRNGAIYFQFDFGGSILASALQGKFNGENDVVVVRDDGLLSVFDLKEKKVIAQKKLDAEVTASPFLIKGFGREHFGLATLSGEVHDFSFDKGVLKDKVVFKTAEGQGFRSSPLSFDFNKDAYSDVFLVDFTGKIYVFDIKNERLLSEGLSVHSEVTATSLLDVYDGKTYVFIASEKGSVFIYLAHQGLELFGRTGYNEEESYKEFLKNDSNKNR